MMPHQDPDPAAEWAAEWAGLLAALERECGNCGGTGRLYSGAWRAWFERSGELVRVAQAARRAAGLQPDRRVTMAGEDTGTFRLLDPALAGSEAPMIVAAAERAIDEHEAARPHEPERAMCRACEGRGSTLTPAGERLADLLTRHGFPRGRRT